jgi:MFS family permease
MVLGTTIVFESVPRERATEAIGIYGVTAAITNAASPFIGELLLARGVSHHSIYLIATMLIAAALLMTFAMSRLRPHLRDEDDITLKGTLRLFRDRRYLIFSAAAFIFGGTFGVIITFFPNFVRSTTSLSFSTFFIIYIAVLIIIRFAALRVIEGADKKLLLVGVFIMGAVMNALMNGMGPLYMLVVVGVLYGITHGVLYPVLNAHLVHLVANGDRGKSNAVFTAIFNSGMMVFSFGGGYLIDYAGTYTAAFNFSSGAFIVAALLVALPAAWGENSGLKTGLKPRMNTNGDE